MQATLATPAASEFLPLIPELVLVGSAFALLMLDLFLNEKQRVVTHLLAVASLVLVAALLVAGTGGQGEAIKEFADLTFWQGAVEFVDQLSLEQDLDRRNAAYAEVLGNFWIFVGVDLGEEEATLVFLGQLFQHRLEHLAGLAPRRPKVHDDGGFHRRLENLGFKIFKRYIKGKLGHDRVCRKLNRFQF